MDNIILDVMADRGLQGHRSAVLPFPTMPQLADQLRASGLTALREVHSGKLAIAWEMMDDVPQEAEIIEFPQVS